MDDSYIPQLQVPVLDNQLIQILIVINIWKSKANREYSLIPQSYNIKRIFLTWLVVKGLCAVVRKFQHTPFRPNGKPWNRGSDQL